MVELVEVEAYPMLWKDVPGRTILLVHDVDAGDAIPIEQHPYWYLLHKKNVVQEGVHFML